MALPLDTGDTIAALLIAAGHLTTKQLSHAKRVQTKLATPKTLLNVFKDLQYISDAQLQQTLMANPTAIRLGDLLVELGHLQKSELEAALNLQKTEGTKKTSGNS